MRKFILLQLEGAQSLLRSPSERGSPHFLSSHTRRLPPQPHGSLTVVAPAIADWLNMLSVGFMPLMRPLETSATCGDIHRYQQGAWQRGWDREVPHTRIHIQIQAHSFLCCPA